MESTWDYLWHRINTQWNFPSIITAFCVFVDFWVLIWWVIELWQAFRYPFGKPLGISCFPESVKCSHWGRVSSLQYLKCDSTQIPSCNIIYIVSHSLSKSRFLSQDFSTHLESRDGVLAPGHSQSLIISSSNLQNHGVALKPNFPEGKFIRKRRTVSMKLFAYVFQENSTLGWLS